MDFSSEQLNNASENKNRRQNGLNAPEIREFLVKNTELKRSELNKKKRPELNQLLKEYLVNLDLKFQTEEQEVKNARFEERESKNLNDQLYDEEIKFKFYSKSADKKPGKGSGEKIPKTREVEFTELNEIKDWRKQLSNFYLQPFKLNNLTWNSVEHYYQASKFKKNNTDFYSKFSVESNSDISKDPLLAKGAGGKTGKSKGKKVRDKGVTVDPDFFTTDRGSQEMQAAMFAKFSQNKELKRMLILTYPAKLVHHTRGSSGIIFTELMNVRKQLL